MMHTDSQGLAVTGAKPEVIAGLDGFVAELLGMGTAVLDIQTLAEQHRECPLAQAYAASLCVFAQSPRQSADGRVWLQRAHAAADSASEHEQIFIAAVEAGISGDLDKAISAHETIAARWPQLRLSAKLAEFHLFETGECARQRKLMAAFSAANADDAELLAMYAFSQELNDAPEEAERLARRALELQPGTPWAEHCLAHVYARRGEIANGIAALTDWAPHWQAKNQYIRSHNSFHLATLHLAECEFGRARELYRNAIWGFQPQTVVEHTDAILLLWYLELAGAGANAAGSWHEIVPHILASSRELVFPFLSILYLFTLVRAGANRQAAELLTDFERHAESRNDREHEAWQVVGQGLARATLAYARGQWAQAAEGFAPLLACSGKGGGSDEQRGVFDESCLVSLMQAGELDVARTQLESRIGGREPTPLEKQWLARVKA
ncbi:MAG: hypothetical protein L0I62_01120 [Gammaproteobacteria bacterium]|nr:hypothetical protein [Gammaproteobacteria bacterium]